MARELERAHLRHLLDGLGLGHSGLALIAGRPGIGKTRLAEEAALEAVSRGMRAVFGHCYPRQGSPLYVPFVEILETVERQLTVDAFREVLGIAAGEMTRLLPGLRQSWPGLPAPLELPPEQERRYFFSSFAEVLDRLGRSAPLMLVLEDLQWADEASLLLLEHLARRDGVNPLLILGTYRDTELDPSTALGATLEELMRIHFTHRLVLTPLDIDGTAQMLQALSGQEPPASAVALIHQAGEGNPFFTEELFHHLADEGSLLDSQGRWRSPPTAVVSVPPGVRLVIERRLQPLTTGVRQVLAAAAVIGPSFSLALTRELTEMGDDALLEALEEAVRAHLVVSPAGARHADFRFAHELIRQTLLEGLSAPRRQALHLRVANAIERLHQAELPVYASDIANQLLLAGSAADAGQAVRFLMLAGDRALLAVAFEDGLQLFERALELLPLGDSGSGADLRFRRGLALRGRGSWDAALTSFSEALDEYARLGDAAAVGHLCAELALQLFYARRFGECAEIVARGLAALGAAITADRVELLSVGGRLFSFAGNFERGEELIRLSIDVAEQIGDDHLLGVALFGSTVHHWACVQPTRALAMADRAADLTRTAGALWDLADGLPFVQLAMILAGRPIEVAHLGEEVEPLAQRIGHYGALMVAGRCRLLTEIMSGDLAAVESSALKDLSLCEQTGLPWLADSYAWLGLAAFWRGDWEAALDAFRKGMSREGPGTVAGACWAGSLLVQAYLGDEARCRAMLADPPVDLPRPGCLSGLGSWTGLLMATEALAQLGAREEAAAQYDLVVEAMAAGNVLRGYDNRLLHAVAGMAAGAGARWELAEDHFRQALHLADTIPHRLDQPDVRRLYALMLLQRNGSGDSATARHMLMEAASLYSNIGMLGHLRLVRALLTDPRLLRAGRAGRASRDDGLTEREVEVLELVAGGHTSREVAKKLSLSTTTVQRHIANIYAKIGVRNRAEATAYALRRGAEPRPT